VLLGMVSPVAVKLRLSKLKDSASTVGRLYAISTLGSIAGTFLAGFYLISYLGTTRMLTLIALSLIALSVIAFPTKIINLIILVLISAYSIFFHSAFSEGQGRSNFIDVDTQYSRVWIYDALNPANNRTMRNMFLNKQYASAIYLDDINETSFKYFHYYNLTEHFKQDIKTALILGGGAYSYPRELAARFPDASIDVVEIDPDLSVLAQKHFFFDKPDNINIFHEDARIFLNRNKKRYDVVFVDVFESKFSNTSTFNNSGSSWIDLQLT
jgi:predicted membrane-bound spermidine synthase